MPLPIETFDEPLVGFGFDEALDISLEGAEWLESSFWA